MVSAATKKTARPPLKGAEPIGKKPMLGWGKFFTGCGYLDWRCRRPEFPRGALPPPLLRGAGAL
jgi:hypothetical protein